MAYAHYDFGGVGTTPRWLATGPQTSPLTHLAGVTPADGSPFGQGGRWAMNYWAFDPEVAALKQRAYAAMPAETARLRGALEGAPQAMLDAQAPAGGAWRFAVTGDDGVVDFSRFNFTPSLMEAALSVAIAAPEARTVRATLLTIGPVQLWLNGALAFEDAERFSYVALRRIPVTLTLHEGLNAIMLYGAMLGWREARLALGMALTPSDAVGLTAAIDIGDIDPSAWAAAESDVQAVQLRTFAVANQPARIWCADDAPAAVTVDAELTIPIPDTPWARLIGLDVPAERARLTIAPGQSADLPLSSALLTLFDRLPGENALRLTVQPVVADDAPWGRHLARHYELWASTSPFSTAPYSTYDQRLAEARYHLAGMVYDVPSSLAAVAIGRAPHIDSAAIAVACAFIDDRADCADFYTVGLLAALYWHADTSVLRPEDQAKIETALRGFKYWIDEPGIDGMCYFTENHQMLFHVSGYLVGQLYPEWVFSNSGLTGAQQRDKAIPKIMRWISTRLEGMFSEWDSNAYMTLDAFALLALVEFADDAQIVDSASRLLDRLFGSLADHTFHGVLGTSHGRCYVSALKSARVENTSPLCRIAFGMGQFNGETRATSLLALARKYRVPELIQRRGAATEGVQTTRARSQGTLIVESDMKHQPWHVETLTVRTPDVMLSAAVDVFPAAPGTMGIQEHLWQATLSPEAIIFTTYPGNSQEHGNARPNFWAGSATLPQVTMTDCDLVCRYQVDPTVGLGFTHAYFPCAAFDEWHIDGPWAFARVGQGYVALWADGPLILIKLGPHAYQELRSGGAGATWACRVGRQADDGTFAAFQQAAHAVPPHIA